MKHLNKPGDNLGGLLKIWAVPFGVFTTQGNTVNFSSQANIWEMYCSADSMEFAESIEVTPTGIHFNTVISGIINQDNGALHEATAYMESRKWIVNCNIYGWQWQL